ncbi:MAG: peptidase M22 [Clostridia bacterium]|nr:peptidase M22 [Clostridia bacterium]
MRDEYILGIDTSNYTTSLGLLDLDGNVVANIKCPLPVREGERGLRQSDALFAHVKNIPSAMQELRKAIGDGKLLAVGVSSRPRNVEGSYMPCFLAGVATAESVAATSGIPLYTFSHQCGHIMAALLSCENEALQSADSFGAFHVSGGTTEVLSVRVVRGGFLAECVGGTKDLNAGQIIDRVGVALGLSFPCGPALERLALGYEGKTPKRKPPLDDCYVNLSGLENMALSLYRETGDRAQVAAFVLHHLADALCGMAQAYNKTHGKGTILFAGGVMCNSIIRKKLLATTDAAFATPLLSADNAVGIACLTTKAYREKMKQ